jgi:PIN domain nuclease of toxin-antitoxin system
MRLLLDTHVLLWAIGASHRLSPDARAWLEDPRNTVLFSAASIWEIAIKSSLGRRDFRVDLPRLVKAALDTGFLELPVSSTHAVRLEGLADLHKDPFDRLLIAQALVESALLLTNDASLSRYGPHVRVL